jgi:hypothetical protein
VSKELIQATERELAVWPGSSFDVLPTGGKHGRLAIKYNDQSRLVIIAQTPSDNRAVPNHLAVVRRMLREMGARKAKNIVGQPAPEQPRQAAEQPQQTLADIGTIIMQSKKIPAILRAIEDLRFGEMLEFAQLLSETAVSMNLRRGRAQDWAMMLQSVAENRDTDQ